jgi:hypothetical protein
MALEIGVIHRTCQSSRRFSLLALELVPGPQGGLDDVSGPAEFDGSNEERGDLDAFGEHRFGDRTA